MRRILVCLIGLLLLVACSPRPELTPAQSAEKYLQEGETYLDKGMYEEAIQAWQKLRDTYYSPETNTLAEIKIAETYYKAKKYTEPAAAYEDFLKNHPNHERVPLMMFELGMCYYEQILSADRDQTATHNALVTFTNLQNRFPDFTGAETLKGLIEVCRNRLAEHEAYVGDFYLRYGHPDAAVFRLKQTLVAYPDYRQVDRVYYLLAKAYIETGNKPQAAATLETLVREHPESQFVPRVRNLVE